MLSSPLVLVKKSFKLQLNRKQYKMLNGKKNVNCKSYFI